MTASIAKQKASAKRPIRNNNVQLAGRWSQALFKCSLGAIGVLVGGESPLTERVCLGTTHAVANPNGRWKVSCCDSSEPIA